jgi:hypothetical protein
MNLTIWLAITVILLAAIFIPRIGLLAVYKTQVKCGDGNNNNKSVYFLNPNKQSCNKK